MFNVASLCRLLMIGHTTFMQHSCNIHAIFMQHSCNKYFHNVVLLFLGVMKTNALFGSNSFDCVNLYWGSHYTVKTVNLWAPFWKQSSKLLSLSFNYRCENSLQNKREFVKVGYKEIVKRTNTDQLIFLFTMFIYKLNNSTWIPSNL